MTEGTPPPAAAERSSDDRLSILLLDYEMAREDERTFNTIQAAVFGVAVALVAGLAALVTRSCAFQPDADPGQCTYIPETALVITPLAPFALVVFVLILGLVATVRSYYLRALEADLRSYVGRPLANLEPIPPGSYTELMSELVSLRRGDSGYPFLVLMIVIAALLIFGGFIVYVFTEIEWQGRVFMLILYGPATLFALLEARLGTVGGRGLFMGVVNSYVTRMSRGEGTTVPSREEREDETPKPERSLTSYLILPRPEEIPKAVFAPIVFVVASLALDSFSADSILRAAVVLFALEYLIYEARYQWNDVRGVSSDQFHRDHESRGRLPLGSDPPESTLAHIRLSLLVGLLRLALAPAIALTVGRSTLVPILALLLAVVAVSVPYELLRSQTDDPSTPATRRRQMSYAIWVLVGGGYLIRGLAGFYLGGFDLLSGVGAMAAISFGAFGVMFVTMTWVLEAVAHSKLNAQGRLEDNRASPPRFHIGLLRRWLTISGPDLADDLIHERALRSSGRVKAPWNVALLCCGGIAGVLGVAVAERGEFDSLALYAGLLTLGGSVLAIKLRGLPLIAPYLLVGVTLVASSKLDGAATYYVAPLPWLLFLGLYISFREQSYYSLKRWLPDIPRALSNVSKWLVSVLVGRRTMDWLKSGLNRAAR